MREPFAVLDADLRLAAASQAFYARFSLSSFSALGTPLFEWGAGEWDTAETRELFERLAPSEQSVEDFPVEVYSPGTFRPRVSVSVRPIREGANRIVSWLVSFAEIETAGAEEAEEIMRRMQRRAGDLVCIVDPDGWGITVAQGGACEMTGYTIGELAGRSLEAMIHAEERNHVLASLRQIDGKLEHRRLAFRIRHRDGRWIWVEALCDDCGVHGLPKGIYLSLRDIGDRKRAEESLRWLGRQVKLILDSAADGIIGLDVSGRISFANPVAARLSGSRVTEMLGRDFRELFPEPAEGVNGPAEAIAATLRDGLGREIRDCSLRSGTDACIPIEIACSVAREHDQITGGVLVFRGIAERKRAEAAARKAEWLAGVGETTFAVRHEINNPLTTLLAEARLLEMGGNTDDEERQMIGAICQEARRIAEVIRRLTEVQDDPVVRIQGNQRMLDLRGN